MRLLPRPKVLICDNEVVMRALVSAALRDGDYELIEASDGDAALEMARSTEPDLIVLDVMMPGRTGFEVLAELRTEERFARTPVVMLTARAQLTDRDAAADGGADRFLGKPFSPRELAAVVDELLEVGRAA